MSSLNLNLQSSTSATEPKKSISRTRSLSRLPSATLEPATPPLFIKGSRLSRQAYGICRPFQKQKATEPRCSRTWSLVSIPSATGMYTAKPVMQPSALCLTRK